MTDKELLTSIQQIQKMMIDASTGEFFNEEIDRNYKELYFKIKVALRARSIKNKNTFSSLNEFYRYWSENLPTYKERRYYINDLYHDGEEQLYLGIEATRPEDDFYTVSVDDFHEEVVLKAKDNFSQSKYDDAVLNTLKYLEIKIRGKANLDNSFYGRSLMQSAFDPTTSPFKIEGERAEIQGWSEIFKGIVGAIRNPLAHRNLGLSKVEAFSILCFLSYLFNFVDSLDLKDKLVEDEIPF